MEKNCVPANQRNILSPIIENSNRPSLDSNIFKSINPLTDKENKPEMAEDTFSRKTSILSLENALHRLSLTPANHRDSMFPPPVAKTPLFPLPAIDKTKDNTSEGRSLSQGGNRVNKNYSVLRRSLQKKLIIRSPLPQSSSRGNVTGEKLRVSIGSRGWRTRRVPGTDAIKTDKGAQKKRQHKEREVGRNIGNTRNAF